MFFVQPHSASLGMTFYDGKMFPSDYTGDVQAEHGSWNRQGSGTRSDLHSDRKRQSHRRV